MRICLFLATPQHLTNIPVPETSLARVKRRLRRGANRLAWRVRPAHHSRNYAWTDRDNSNKGDHAIRLAIRDQLAAALAPEAVSFTELGWDELTPETADGIGRSHDLFVIAGSGYFFLDGQGDATARLDRDATLLARLDCPVVAYGAGLNRNLGAPDAEAALPADAVSPRGASVLARLLGSLAAVGVRDATAQRVLQRLTDRRVDLMGDPVLFWPDPPPDAPRPVGETMRIGVNLAYHGNAMGPRLARNLPAYAGFLRRLAAEMPAELHYIIHYDAERAVPLMLRSHGVKLTVHDVPAGKLAPVYRTLDLHVCEMLHSSIMAVAAGVPTLNVGYDVKNRAFYEMLGVERFCLDAGALSEESLWHASQELVGGREEFVATVAARAAGLEQARDALLDRIREIAASGSGAEAAGDLGADGPAWRPALRGGRLPDAGRPHPRQ
jgi:hypothetical protein